MPEAKLETKPTQAQTFEAVLERTPDRLRWIIARLPFDAAQLWGKRGQIRIKGEINGFAFSGILFPTGAGTHFLIVNKKLLAGGKTAPGLTAKFRLQPDTTLRPSPPPAKELFEELGQSKRLLKFYESLNPSRRREIAKWIAECKTPDARQRRSRQIAERLMETMEAERELPPMIEMAFRQNPRARERWNQLSPSHRRRHLLAIFYYREPESRMRRLTKVMEEMLSHGEKGGDSEEILD